MTIFRFNPKITNCIQTRLLTHTSTCAAHGLWPTPLDNIFCSDNGSSFKKLQFFFLFIRTCSRHKTSAYQQSDHIRLEITFLWSTFSSPVNHLPLFVPVLSLIKYIQAHRREGSYKNVTDLHKTDPYGGFTLQHPTQMDASLKEAICKFPLPLNAVSCRGQGCTRCDLTRASAIVAFTRQEDTVTNHRGYTESLYQKMTAQARTS